MIVAPGGKLVCDEAIGALRSKTGWLDYSANFFHIDMRVTCMYDINMTKMIQLRNVPDSLHRKLKARAALEGLSLSDYLLAELRRYGERPTLREVRERLSHRQPVHTQVPPADAVREDRERL